MVERAWSYCIVIWYKEYNVEIPLHFTKKKKMKTFFLRKNKISHNSSLKEDFYNLQISDDCNKQEIKEYLVHYKFEDVLVFNSMPIITYSKFGTKIPINFQGDVFVKCLNDFFEIFKTMVLRTMPNKNDVCFEHTDEVDNLKLCFIHAYNLTLSKFPYLEQNPYVMNKIPLFTHTLSILDQMSRYVKDCYYTTRVPVLFPKNVNGFLWVYCCESLYVAAGKYSDQTKLIKNRERSLQKVSLRRKLKRRILPSSYLKMIDREFYNHVLKSLKATKKTLAVLFIENQLKKVTIHQGENYTYLPNTQILIYGLKVFKNIEYAYCKKLNLHMYIYRKKR